MLKSTVVVIICLSISILSMVLISGSPPQASLSNSVGNYFLGYQPKLVKYMQKFKLVITDARNYSKRDIVSLRKKGVIVIGYVSLGESVKLEKGDGLGPGGYASWYFDKNNDGIPDYNKQYKSYYTNVSNSQWVSQVINAEIKKVADKGVDGFFLDTVDTIENYPETKNAMIDLIKKIRQKYPDKILVQNWGFSIIESTVPYINAVMWESWYPDSNDKWTINLQNKLNKLREKYGIYILTLGYYETYSNFERYYEESKSLGFIPYIISDENIDKTVGFFSKKDIFD